MLRKYKSKLWKIFQMLTQDKKFKYRKWLLDIDAWLQYLLRIHILDNDAMVRLLLVMGTKKQV